MSFSFFCDVWGVRDSCLVGEKKIDRAWYVVPRRLELAEEIKSERSDGIIFPWRSLHRLFPAIGKQSVILKAGEERIESPFHHDEMSVLKPCYHLGSIGIATLKEKKNAELKHAFAHLWFEIVYVHDSMMKLLVGYGNGDVHLFPLTVQRYRLARYYAIQGTIK